MTRASFRQFFPSVASCLPCEPLAFPAIYLHAYSRGSGHRLVLSPPRRFFFFLVLLSAFPFVIGVCFRVPTTNRISQATSSDEEGKCVGRTFMAAMSAMRPEGSSPYFTAHLAQMTTSTCSVRPSVC